MSGLQFFCQHLIARAVLALGLAQRQAEGELPWREYVWKGGPAGRSLRA